MPFAFLFGLRQRGWAIGTFGSTGVFELSDFSGVMPLSQARELIEHTASALCETVAGAFWRWRDDRYVEVYRGDGSQIATLRLEAMQ